MDTKKVWLVTGASKGLGQTLVRKLLAGNCRVAATSRNIANLIQEFGGVSASFLPLQLDLTSDQAVGAAINRIITHFGRVDVVVNNAGFGLIGTLEALSDAEVRDNFDVNVFGALNIVRSVSPFLRKQRSGHILNISSIGGYAGGFPGFGIYCATKFAVAGFTESLAEEMKDFGVHVTVVYPGYFRTNFLASDSIKTAANPVMDYESARASEQAHLKDIDGNQPNDPERAAEIFIELTEMSAPPVHLFLGKDAYAIANQKIAAVQETMSQYEVLGTSTDLV